LGGGGDWVKRGFFLGLLQAINWMNTCSTAPAYFRDDMSGKSWEKFCAVEGELLTWDDEVVEQ